MDFLADDLLFLEAERDESVNNSLNSRILAKERKLLRDKNAVSNISCERFIELFRINKEIFQYLLEEVGPYVSVTRSTAIPIHIQLLTVLRVLAIGDYQRAVGGDLLLAVSQTSVSRLMSKIIPIFEEKLCPKWIKWPENAEDRVNIKEGFFERFGFPSVLGVIDGTHIQMASPHENEHLYINRKGTHSLNVQIICDSKMRITSIDANHPGSTHDASNWNISPERHYMRNVYNEDKCWLLGDAGYPLEPWMITPFRNTTAGSIEARYNEKHSKARSIIERCFGVLKNRWRILLSERSLRYQPQQYISIINVCVALHNMCIDFNVAADENSFQTNADDNPTNLPEVTQARLRTEGELNRQHIMNAILH